MKTCCNCFHKIDDAAQYCVYCGSPADIDNRKKYPLALPCNTVLHKEYTIGRVLGQGSFGITYIARDNTTDERITIKEFCPENMVTRDEATLLLNPKTPNVSDIVEEGESRFIREARILAELNNCPNIVKVYSYFEENNTAYYSMEYISGSTLKKYIAEKEGRIPFKETLGFLVPVMENLDRIHKTGIIHGNISPDNIMVTSDGTAKLLGFDSAKFFIGKYRRSMSSVLNRGFSPSEQYRAGSARGPWTDVYSMAASIYKAITGIDPPDALDRFGETDPLLPPSRLGARVSAAEEKALMKALSRNPRDRFQSMQDFIGSLTNRHPANRPLTNSSFTNVPLTNSSFTNRPHTDSSHTDRYEVNKNNRDSAVSDVETVRIVKSSEDKTPTETLYRPGIDKPGIPGVGASGDGSTGVSGYGAPPIRAEKRKAKIWKPLLAATCAVLAVIFAVTAAVMFLNAPSQTSLLQEDIFNKKTEDNNYDLASSREYSVFGSKYKRSEIGTVTFLSGIKDAPDGSWDVSGENDGSVLAWAEEDDGFYHLTIAGKGTITAPANLQGMFMGYVNLRSIEWNNAVDMQNVRNMKTMFCGCEKLELLDLAPFQSAKPVTLRFMLKGCTSLRSLNLSPLNTSEATDLAGLFYGCSSLKELDLSGFQTKKAESVKSMFCKCSSLETVVFGSGFSTSKVNIFNYMFKNCTNLTSLDLRGFDLKNAKKAVSMFDGCTSLQSLDMGGLDLSNVEMNEDMFKGCSSLETMTFSGSVHLGDQMFSGCSGLKDLHFDKSVLSIGEKVFSGCDISVHYPGEDDSWDTAVGRGYEGNVKWVSSDGIVVEVKKDNILIPDAALKKAIQKSLKISDREITKKDAESLRELVFDGKDHSEKGKISDLTGLDAFRNLESIDLSHNKITDLSHLRHLRKLTWLTLYKNDISDISPLEDLRNLISLNLSHNEVSDLTPLKGLEKLRTLNLSSNSITDLSVLENLKQLMILNVEDNPVEDYSVLDKLPDTMKITK